MTWNIFRKCDQLTLQYATLQPRRAWGCKSALISSNSKHRLRMEAEAIGDPE